MIKRLLFIGASIITLNSCCYCVVNVPDLYPIPEDWEFELVEDCDTTEVIPCDK